MDNQNTSSSILKNIFWRTFNVFANSLLAIVISIMTARILGPEVMGQFSYVIWLSNVLLIFMGLGIPAAVTKYVAEYVGKGDLVTAKSIIKSLFILEVILGSLITVVSIGLVFFVVPEAEQLIFLLAIGNRLPMALGAIFNAGVQGLQDFKSVSKLEVFAEFSRSVLIAIFLVLGYELVGIFTAALIVNVYYFVRIYFLYRKNFKDIEAKLGFPRELITRMIKFCLTLSGIMIISSIVWQQSEVFFLYHYSTKEQIAFYSLAFGVAEMFTKFPPILSQVFMPLISNMSQSVGMNKINKLFADSSSYIALVFVPIFIGAAALIGKPILLMYGEEYREVILPAVILLSFNIFGAITIISGALTTGTDQQHIILKWGAIVAVVNIAADFLLIPEYGAIGAAIANSFAQTFGAIGGTWLVLRSYGFSFPVVKISKIILSGSLMGACVYWIDQSSPGWFVFFIAIPIGVIVYCVSIKIFRIFKQKDHDFMMQFEGKIPSSLQSTYRVALNFLLAK